jgi:TPR repeat protein
VARLATIQAQALLLVAARDDREAQLEVALGYADADWGFAAHAETAFVWMRKAAEGGSWHARAELAGYYTKGKGCEQNEKEGLRLHREAEASGDALAAALSLQSRLGKTREAARAFAAMLKVAKSGDRLAQCAVASMFAYGEGVKRDMKTAVLWARKAAEQNLSKAQALLGNALENGSGVKRDRAEAFHWYERAAFQGSIDAMVAAVHMQGLSWTSQNSVMCYRWLWRASRLGHPRTRDVAELPKPMLDSCIESWELECISAACWWEENEFMFDTAQTFGWLEIGAKRGDMWSQFYLGRAYRLGDYGEPHEARAHEWIRRSAEQGFDSALLATGYRLLSSAETGGRFDKAVDWAVLGVTKGCEGGRSVAAWNLYLSIAALRKVGFPRFSPEMVLKVMVGLEGEAESGFAQAQGFLGYCHAYGQAMEQDDLKAVRWFAKAAEAGVASAQVGLGMRLKRGLGATRDEAKAAEWFAKASKSDDADALFQLGICYVKGQGVAEDAAEGVRLFRRAAERGHAFGRRCVVACAAAGLGMARDEELALRMHEELEGKGTLADVQELGRHAMRVIDESEVFATAKPLVEFEFVRGGETA